MRSLRDDALVAAPGERALADSFYVWNRRIHYYLGLYLLFFTWLFVFTGLLLNHPRWEFAQFWPKRLQTTVERQVQTPLAGSDLERARDLMRQLDLVGEIEWRAPEPGPFAFQVSRPGLVVEVKTDLAQGRATVQRTALNAWGVLHLLHTFTGVHTGDERNSRDWMLTTVWAASMDAVALGLIVMVFSSYIMWYRLKTKRLGGIVAVLLGVIGCGALVLSLRF